MKRTLILLCLVVGVSAALVRAYSVEPRTAEWSGWTRLPPAPNYYVSEVITVAFDLLDSTSGAYCELFAGSRGAGGAYHLSVLTYPGGSPITQVAYAGGDVDHEWVRFYLHVTYPESIVKGKQLEFKFTRSGSDSIQFYYDAFAGTKYDSMIVPGGGFQPGPEPARPALCCRIFGVMEPCPAEFWGYNVGG
ncbi:MAG: hypothetical protein ABIL25_04110 [candidate division WOR-3 bacterium]